MRIIVALLAAASIFVMGCASSYKMDKKQIQNNARESFENLESEAK
jgi:hypothetical protein